MCLFRLSYTAVLMRILNYPINIAFWSFFAISSLVLFLGACLIWLFTLPLDPNRRILQKYSCLWSTLYVWLNPYWSVKTSGKQNLEKNKVYIMVSNHKSIVDILVLFKTFLHFKWVSKASMFKAPILGWNMKLNGYIPIERGDSQSREKCMNHCREWLAKGSSVLFFPEGTRSKEGIMRPFKLGAFHLALETGTDILPLVIEGSEDAVPKHSIMLTKKSKMKVRVLPPISIKGYDLNKLPEEVQRLANDVQGKIQEALNPTSSPLPAF